MGRGVTVAQQAHAILEAMKSDVNFLLRSYLSQCSEISSYEVFVDLFQNMQMETIFVGRLSISDFVEFSENLLSYVASLVYHPSERVKSPAYVNQEQVELSKGLELNHDIASEKVYRTLPLQVSAIYLLYTLYFLQPLDYMAMIRISTLQMKNLRELVRNTLVPIGELEAVYCVMRLIEANAFAITPFERDFDPIVPYQMNVSSLSADGPVAKTTKELIESIQADSRIRDIHREYQALVMDSLDEPSLVVAIDDMYEMESKDESKMKVDEAKYQDGMEMSWEDEN